MKNKKYLAAAMLTGITFGGLSIASVASAEGNRSENIEESVEADENVEGTILQIQDEADDAEGTDEDGDNDGRRNRRSQKLSTAAEVIGIEVDELRTALQDGDSIADVAEANGVDADDVIDALVEAKTERIAAKVEAERLTQEEADEKLAELEARITDRVNGVDSDNDNDGDDDDSEDDTADA